MGNGVLRNQVRGANNNKNNNNIRRDQERAKKGGEGERGGK